jgi:hypothetical protein
MPAQLVNISAARANQLTKLEEEKKPARRFETF